MLLLVATPVVAGPVIGLANFTTNPWGDASVTNAPSTATVDHINASRMRFDAAPVTIDVSNIHGNPVLVYKIHIPELQYYNTGLQYLSEGDSTVVLDTPNGTLSSSEVQDTTYVGVVNLELRAGERVERIYSSNITVEVRE